MSRATSHTLNDRMSREVIPTDQDDLRELLEHPKFSVYGARLCDGKQIIEPQSGPADSGSERK